jgi:hypothetical protein
MLDFGYQIYHKKEFNQYEIPPQAGESKRSEIHLMQKKCSLGVKTSDTQKLLKNFSISLYTISVVYWYITVWE